MNNSFLKESGLFILAVIFSLALMFSFTELPQLLDRLMQALIGTPQSDPAYDAAKIEMFYNAYNIRLIGYICLGLILLLIILGFASRKSGFAHAGGIILFLPVFATFAGSMFYLAGLGLLNVIVFPFLDSSVSLMDLGRVVMVPYWVLMWFLGLFGWHAHKFLLYFFMISGALVFVLGVFAWFRARSGKEKIARHWIYKYSRHPQYMGWIIWSYGLMLFGPSVNNMKKSWGWHSTLPWLLSTMIIIGICLLEELKMRKSAGEDYNSYRDKTPFLFFVPGWFKKIINMPLRLLFRKNRPERRREIAVVVGIYTIVLLALSLIWVDLKPEDTAQQNELPLEFSQARADSLVAEIRREQARRTRSSEPFTELIRMGEESYPLLIELMKDPDPVIREFAFRSAIDNNLRESIPVFFEALDDKNGSVGRIVLRGFRDMKVTEAKDTLLYFARNPAEHLPHDLVLSALASIKCREALPYFEAYLNSDTWWQYTGALRNIYEIYPELGLEYIYESLDNDDPLVRREAVYMLIDNLPEDAIPHLEKVLNDRQWEVRFYAKQAISMIKEKYPAAK